MPRTKKAEWLYPEGWGIVSTANGLLPNSIVKKALGVRAASAFKRFTEVADKLPETRMQRVERLLLSLFHYRRGSKTARDVATVLRFLDEEERERAASLHEAARERNRLPPARPSATKPGPKRRKR